MKTRVAIIGGGISGLTALNELSNDKEIDATLFEADRRVGGRILTEHVDDVDIELGASYFHKFYRGFFYLINDLGLSDRKIPYKGSSKGFLKDGEVVSLSKLNVALSRIFGSLSGGGLTRADAKSFFKLKSETRAMVEEGNRSIQAYLDSEKMAFQDVLSGFPLIREGYRTPFSDFANTLTPTVREKFLNPFMRHTIFVNIDETNDAIGKAIFVPKDFEIYTFKGGMQSVPKELERRYKERIRLGNPVLKVEKTENGYRVLTPETDQEFDVVVSAVPLSKLEGKNGIFPQIATGVKYANARKIIVRGSLKRQYAGVDDLYIGDGNSGIDGISKRGKNLYKISTKVDDPKLDEFFNVYDRINRLRDVSWPEAVPIVDTKTAIPSTETEFGGFYLVGDFALPCMEMAVDTGLKVARRIIRNIYQPV